MKPKFSPIEYLVFIRMSDEPHLLVEGTDDYEFFLRIRDDLYLHAQNSSQIECPVVVIDKAESLIRFDTPMGNREKVEYICDAIADKSYSHKLVGFVDREFRGFDLTLELKDLLDEDYVNGRLVWSRGHSVENYHFDSVLLNSAMRDLGNCSSHEVVYALFTTHFDMCIRLACAISLAAFHAQCLEKVLGSISWEYIVIESNVASWDKDLWKAHLVNIRRLPDQQADLVVNQFSSWLERTLQADIEVVRWLCHGHIGFKFLWEFYAYCIFQVASELASHDNQEAAAADAGIESNTKRGRTQAKSKARNGLGVSESARFKSCSTNLATNLRHKEYPYPQVVFDLLGISRPDYCGSSRAQ